MTQENPKLSRVLLAPVSGLITPLTKVPDPTFAKKLVGDGVAIDPTDERLLSPCDGVISQLHPAGHALTVTTPDGLEVLIHIGLETVLLKGKGFSPKVKTGQKVKAADPLIDFDANFIIHNATSLLTILVVANPERLSGLKAPWGLAEAGKTQVLRLTLAASSDDPTGAEESELLWSDPIVILNPSGLHARPAAVLANNAKRFVSQISIAKEDGLTGNAKSVVGLLNMDIKAHDRVFLRAKGPDASEALAALSPLLISGLGEHIHGTPIAPPQPKAPRLVSNDPNVLVGVAASPGQALGRIFQLRYQEIAVTEKAADKDQEKDLLLKAIDKAKLELKELRRSLRQRAEAGKAAIFEAHEELLEDPELLAEALKGIAHGRSAAFAWRAAFTSQAETLGKLNNELLAGRANDIRDIGRRVLRGLTDLEPSESAASFPEDAILVSEDLTPSDTASLDPKKIQGIATTGGSATSHASILARAANIPAIAAIEERALDIPSGTLAALDGDTGRLTLNPPEELILTIKESLKAAAERRRKEMSAAQDLASTVDGHRVKVVGNIGGLAEAKEIPPLGGEGVGLLRSEFLFLHRAVAPTQEEQEEVYVAIAKTLGKERDLIVRTLDVGGDKPLAYLPLPPEANPFLGVRGIRLNILGLDLFTAQVRAILKAAPFVKLRIMFPMITSLSEILEAKAIVLREKESLGIKEEVKIGVMVEVPAAALLAENLAKEVDFFSVGTNDLTQYTLAIDRGHPKLAKDADGLHPAVLRLIDRTVQGAHAQGKWVGVCGGIAGDLTAAPVLIGLGVDELSVSGGSIPAIKALTRRLNQEECAALAQEVLLMSEPSEVRAYLAQKMKAN
ncbi:MAG: phosphoenolpyruvate--protein phosphotransferase [Deltaproteobacteria bacterium]|jgi:phosphocarrier protein FPr|nr:phosphoenolpyruvate--protein phosphotransferase [Deltaproteobacteria bacterium]